MVAAALKAQCPRTPKRQMRVGNACAFTRRRRQSPVWGPAPLLARLRPPWPVLPLALDVFCGLATPGAVQRFSDMMRTAELFVRAQGVFCARAVTSPPLQRFQVVSSGFRWFQVVSPGCKDHDWPNAAASALLVMTHTLYFWQYKPLFTFTVHDRYYSLSTPHMSRQCARASRRTRACSSTHYERHAPSSPHTLRSSSSVSSESESESHFSADCL